MGTRVLDWNGLLALARPRLTSAQRVITMGGVPARVKPHRGYDVGFYVHKLDTDAPDQWSLRKDEGMAVLRALVEAGQVTVDDPDEPARCFMAGCRDDRIDGRGPIRMVDGRELPACTPHWDALFDVLDGQADNRDSYDDHLEQAVTGAGRVVREVCGVCGGGRRAHDRDKHDIYDARMEA
jgi:hypothetical protein